MHDHLTGGFRVIDISNKWIASFPESVSNGLRLFLKVFQVYYLKEYDFVYTRFNLMLFSLYVMLW